MIRSRRLRRAKVLFLSPPLDSLAADRLDPIAPSAAKIELSAKRLESIEGLVSSSPGS
jgi:hypothetical protein